MTPLEIANDCTRLDATETVSVTLRRPEGETTFAVGAALRRALSRAARPYGGISLAGEEIVWHVPQNAFETGLALRPGDTIAAGGDTWSVIAADLETLGSRWRCLCRKQP